MSDQFDEQSERLLPCTQQQDLHEWCEGNFHHHACPAIYRPAVAAALREAEERSHWTDKQWGERWQRGFEAGLAKRDKQLADLRAELSEYKSQLEAWLAANSPGGWIYILQKQLADLRAERDQLKARLIDLQRALGNEFQDPPECGQVTEGAQIHRMKGQIANLCAENDQLRKSLDHMNDCCLRAEAERDQLRAQSAEYQNDAKTPL